MEIQVEDDELDMLKDDAHSTHDKPSIFGSRSYLSDTRAAVSMEDLHCESEGPTYLVKTGQELHITRHGIEFADVKGENCSERLITKQEENNAEKKSCEKPETFFIPTDSSDSHKNNKNGGVIAPVTENENESDKLLQVTCVNENGGIVDNGRCTESSRTKEPPDTSRCCRVWHVIKNISAFKLLG